MSFSKRPPGGHGPEPKTFCTALSIEHMPQQSKLASNRCLSHKDKVLIMFPSFHCRASGFKLLQVPISSNCAAVYFTTYVFILEQSFGLHSTHLCPDATSIGRMVPHSLESYLLYKKSICSRIEAHVQPKAEQRT